jgi:hypothetical protein
LTPGPGGRCGAGATHCVTCGEALAGDYCSVCGEKRAGLHDLRLRTFLRQAFESVFNLDARAYRSFGALLGRPGLLTAEYVAGRRTPWLPPIQVFLIANLIFFIALSVISLQAVTTTLHSQLEAQVYSDLVRRLVRARFLSMETVDFAAFEARFNFATEQYAKTLVLLLAPGFAAVLALLHAGRREPFVKHLVFGLHLLAFLLLVLLLVGTAVLATWRILPAAGAVLQRESTLTILLFIVLGPYFYLGMRRVYRSHPVTAALRATLLFLSLPLLLLAYRFILFLAVFYTI